MTGQATRPQRRPDGAALVIAVMLAAVGGTFIVQGRASPDNGGYSGVGSGDAPIFVGVVLVLLAIAHVVKGLRSGPVGLPVQHLGPVGLIVGGLLLQLVLLRITGFSIASGLLFACTASAFGHRNPAISVPVGIVLAIAVYGVFDQLLRLNLPAGWLELTIFGS
ncbi:putative tricarboxylic transport membrane protein [Loktanella fryxellensis]|uniref:Putative tricarboxylic transport membrane protein n=1 Tax=Loktanella fryxellensis TaxID=245187 RepID=A0A1H8BS32_9RHOB|nr:tripartite tricarboxylate transporter TctB family protein [Loktanella fryxellensis]SEM85675.1 putative tricarboxylic transport membrane protein [Loktanella fryxellensis]